MTFVPLQPPDLPPIRARGTPRCRGCGLPQEMCLCGALPRLSVRTRVVLLTHRIERTRSTNTGRLVARLLEGAEVRVRGEVAPQPRSPLPEGRRLMLFPSPGARALSPDSDAWLSEARARYQAAAQQTAKALKIAVPEGGTFVFFDTRPYLQKNETPEALLERCARAGVVLTPGVVAGAAYRAWARLCFTCVPPSVLTRALATLQRLLYAARS